MAKGSSSGTDPTLDAQLKLMAAQTGLTVAQIQQIAEERGIKREELAQRGAIATEGFKVDREKIGLGREEMSQKDKQAKLAAALDALNLGSKEKIAGQSERAGLQSDLTRRPDVPLDIVARTAAANGDPALFNALAAKKLQDREKLITSMIPAIQSAKSDAEREKKIYPALEAAYPGSSKEARARAFPATAGSIPTATPEPTPPSTVAPMGDTTNPLAATLLAAAGFGGGGATGSATSGAPRGIDHTGNRDYNYPVLPNTPEPRYVPQGAGPLEGSRLVLDNGRPGLITPSGGFIGKVLQGEIDRFAPGQTLSKQLGQLVTPNVPTPQGAGEPVAPPAFDFGALLANNATSPVPNPTPTVTPQMTPTPAVNDAEAARLAELERQRKLREALALQARNSQ